MSRKTCLQLFFFLPLLCPAQSRIRPLYGFNANNGIEHVVNKSPELKTNNARALGFYFHLGLQKEIDSMFVLQACIRYGHEKSRFEVYRNGILIKDHYYFLNRTIVLFFSPGLVITKRQKLFLTVGLGGFYPSNASGSGSTATRFTQRSYTYAIHLNRNLMDYRLGLKWQIKPNPRKKLNVEFGTETSWVEHQSFIEIRSGNNNSAPEFYKLNFSVLLLSLGITFSKG